MSWRFLIVRPTWQGSWTGMDSKECYRLTHPLSKISGYATVCCWYSTGMIVMIIVYEQQLLAVCCFILPTGLCARCFSVGEEDEEPWSLTNVGSPCVCVTRTATTVYCQFDCRCDRWQSSFVAVIFRRIFFRNKCSINTKRALFYFVVMAMMAFCIGSCSQLE